MGSSPTRVAFCCRAAPIAPGVPRPPPGAAAAQGPPGSGRAQRGWETRFGSEPGTGEKPGPTGERTRPSVPVFQGLLLPHRSTGMVELPLAHREYILSKKSIFTWLVSALPESPSAPSAAFFPQAPQAMAAGTGATDTVT